MRFLSPGAKIKPQVMPVFHLSDACQLSPKPRGWLSLLPILPWPVSAGHGGKELSELCDMLSLLSRASQLLQLPLLHLVHGLGILSPVWSFEDPVRA